MQSNRKKMCVLLCLIIQMVFISRTLSPPTTATPTLLSPLFNSPLPPLSLAPEWLPDLHLTWHLISFHGLSHDLIRQLSTQHCCCLCLCLTGGFSGNTQFPALDGDCSHSPEWKGILLLTWSVLCCGEGGVCDVCFLEGFSLFSAYITSTFIRQIRICKNEMWNDSDIFDKAPCREDKRMYLKGNILISNQVSCVRYRFLVVPSKDRVDNKVLWCIPVRRYRESTI